jgi:hypothetical protein
MGGAMAYEQPAEPPALTFPETRRFFFLSPGEPRDVKTLEGLLGQALAECRDELLTDNKAFRLLEAIGRTGRDRYAVALELKIAGMVSRALAKPDRRQPVHNARVRFDSVPQPRKGVVYGVIKLKAWGHSIRSTYTLTIQGP